MEIRALQEVEPWTAPSIVAGAVLLIATIVVIVWLVRRFLNG
jgi:hypothetical protein